MTTRTRRPIRARPEPPHTPVGLRRAPAPVRRADAGTTHGGRGRRPGPDRAPPSCRCAATVSPCSVPASRTPGWRPGPGSSHRWPARARRCTGCSGWSPACPTTGGAVRPTWTTTGSSDADSPAARSYRSLLDESAPVTRRHRVLVAVTVHRGGRPGPSAARAAGSSGATAVLAREVEAVHRALAGADLGVDGVLEPWPALARVLAEAAPGRDGGRRRSGRRRTVRHGRPVADGPRGPVGRGAHRRDVARRLLGERVAPGRRPPRLPRSPAVRPAAADPVAWSWSRSTRLRAARQVAQARTAGLADGELRRRNGFLTSARHTRERESVDDRDVELADGHAQFRFTRLRRGHRGRRGGADGGVRRARAGRRPVPARGPPAVRPAGRRPPLPAPARPGLWR